MEPEEAAVAIARLKADAEAPVGALHQATVEKSHLHHQLAARASAVRQLRTQPPFPG
ncbi:hypothetical protein [Streptomyces sp. NPDC001980]|uniref:hypothetical protein n=1 Tax=Streptomyces sp. NPDC001980 TaxID=3157126 RepID=UPI0033333FF1